MAVPDLPADLESQALARFDQLKARGELFYEPSDPEYIFEFRISKGIKKKPILPPDAPGRSQAIGPFVDPDPQFVVSYVGPEHTLELSMYCVLRPNLILHTNEFCPQTDPLNLADFEAVIAIMQTMKIEQLVLYNCGAEAGASQGHKHLQALPSPETELFPDQNKAAGDGPSIEPWSVPGILFKQWALKFPSNPSPQDLLFRYEKLLEKVTEKMNEISAPIAYNVVIRKPWIVLIPRTHDRARDGRGPTNGAGMMGMVWVADQEERDDWTDLGMSDHLSYLGVPA